MESHASATSSWNVYSTSVVSGTELPIYSTSSWVSSSQDISIKSFVKAYEMMLHLPSCLIGQEVLKDHPIIQYLLRNPFILGNSEKDLNQAEDKYTTAELMHHLFGLRKYRKRHIAVHGVEGWDVELPFSEVNLRYVDIRHTGRISGSCAMKPLTATYVRNPTGHILLEDENRCCLFKRSIKSFAMLRSFYKLIVDHQRKRYLTVLHDGTVQLWELPDHELKDSYERRLLVHALPPNSTVSVDLSTTGEIYLIVAVPNDTIFPNGI